VGQHKLANEGVQGEAVHALADGQHDGGGAGVQAVARALQVLARLAHIQYALLLHAGGRHAASLWRCSIKRAAQHVSHVWLQPSWDARQGPGTGAGAQLQQAPKAQAGAHAQHKALSAGIP